MTYTPFDYAPPGCPECVLVRGEPCNGCKDCHDHEVRIRAPWKELFRRDTVRTARKLHYCVVCDRAILPGERYTDMALMVEGDGEKHIDQAKFCASCTGCEEGGERG